jgi:outer membrane protein assembly factor BamB
MQEEQDDPLAVEISNLDASEQSSVAERSLKRVEEWFWRRARRPRLLLAGATMSLVFVLLLLVLRSALPGAELPVPARVSSSPSMNLFTTAIESVPGETLVVSPDGVVSALHQGTGTVIWHYQEGSGVWGVPIVVQGTIFVNTGNGRVIALQATTGKVLWSHYKPAFSASVLQVMHEGIVFVRDMAARTPGGSVAALRVSDGSLLWQLSTFHFAGFVADEGAGVAYIRDASGRITAVGIRDGLPQWAEHTAARNWLNAAGNRVYVATRDGEIDALAASSGTPLWHKHLRVGALGAPLISGESIFVPNAGGGMSVLDATTGDQRWAAEAEPFIIASGLVYSLTNDGRMDVLRARDGKLLKWYQGIESVLPTEVDGVIFAVSSGGLIALQASSGLLLWHWQAPSPVLAVYPAGPLVFVSVRSSSGVMLRVRDGSLSWQR